LVARFSLLGPGRFLGENNLDNCQEALDLNLEQPFFFWRVGIDDFLFIKPGDLVESGDFALEDLSDPDSSLDNAIGSPEHDELLLFVEE